MVIVISKEIFNAMGIFKAANMLKYYHYSLMCLS